MSELQDYDRGSLFLANTMLTECQSFDVNNDAKLNQVHTMQKGFAGMSPGSPICEVNVQSALPRAGVDYDALKAMQGIEIVEFVCFLGAKKMKSKGYITNVKFASGVDKSAEVSYTFIGRPLSSSTL